VEEQGIVRFAEGCAEEDEGVLAGGEINAEVYCEGASDSAFGKAGGEGAVGRL
jgi:hypothetical protein